MKTLFCVSEYFMSLISHEDELEHYYSDQDSFKGNGWVFDKSPTVETHRFIYKIFDEVYCLKVEDTVFLEGLYFQVAMVYLDVDQDQMVYVLEAE